MGVCKVRVAVIRGVSGGGAGGGGGEGAESRGKEGHGRGNSNGTTQSTYHAWAGGAVGAGLGLVFSLGINTIE